MGYVGGFGPWVLPKGRLALLATRKPTLERLKGLLLPIWRLWWELLGIHLVSEGLPLAGTRLWWILGHSLAPIGPGGEAPGLGRWELIFRLPGLLEGALAARLPLDGAVGK